MFALYIQGTTNVVCLILGDLSQSARTLGEVVKRKTFVKAETDNCTDWEIHVDKQGYQVFQVQMFWNHLKARVFNK